VLFDLNVALDQETPRRTLQGYLDACRVSDFARAAHYMDLRSIARSERADRGPALAEQLAYVLERSDPIDTSKLPDDALVKDLGTSPLVVGTTFLEGEAVPIEVSRVPSEDGASRWLLAGSTVAAIPALYTAHGPPSFEAKLPRWLRRAPFHGNAAWQWIGVALGAGLSYASGFALAWAVLAVARRLRGVQDSAGAVFLDAARRPLRILLASLFVRESVVPLRLTNSVSSAIADLTYALIAFTIAWFAIRALRSGVEWASEHLPVEPEQEIRHRVLRTQLTLLRQLLTAVIIVVAMGAVLMQFEFVRNVGLSLLASAGLLGIILGFAAQKPLAGLIGGIQLSITQPIRIGDTVFIERELGTVEKIHLTYVVVRLREQRMLVVPVARFLDSPFENWTLAAPDVIGSVLISVDFSTPVSAVRAELARACTKHDGWDGKTCSLDVTDATERTMTLRALVSSSDSAKNWALRCFVRECLIAFLGKLDGGTHLPHDRDGSMSPLGHRLEESPPPRSQSALELACAESDDRRSRPG
jgi:small-conductance mechanosensitive channel